LDHRHAIEDFSIEAIENGHNVGKEQNNDVDRQPHIPLQFDSLLLPSA
jgi:hypothetical protein